LRIFVHLPRKSLSPLMKIFILGSKSDLETAKRDLLDNFCHKLGEQIARSDHAIIVCSAERSAADFQVIRGIAAAHLPETSRKLIVHRPDDETIKNDWRELERELSLSSLEYFSHTGPHFRKEDGSISSQEGLLNCFLLCQMGALKECDLVVAIGGRSEGSASVILAIAREQRKPILPFRFLGGAAESVFNKIEGDLRQNLGNDVEKLGHQDDGASAFLSLIERLQARTSTRLPAELRFFLSYSWQRGEYADLVEAFLRRLDNISLFRDEHEIPSGGSITAKVELELTNRCNVFLALWGREYVESPHCYDEMHLWYSLRGLDSLYLLRFDNTRPVWPFLRKSPEDTNDFARKWPIVNISKRRSILENELREFIKELKHRQAGE
jgi:hypothetical protein